MGHSLFVALLFDFDGEDLADTSSYYRAMLFMLLLHVEDSLEYLLLVFQSLPFFRQPLDLVFQVLILRHYLLLLATEMSNDVGFFESL